jgi:hypothetical protein
MLAATRTQRLLQSPFITRRIRTTTIVLQQQHQNRNKSKSASSSSPTSRQSTGVKGIKNKLKKAWRQAVEEVKILEAEELAQREKVAKIPGSKAMTSTALEVQSDNKLSINAEQKNAEEADFAEVSLCGLDPCEAFKVCSLAF